VAVVGRNAIPNATPAAVTQQVQAQQTECPVAPYTDYAQYRAAGGYALAAECVGGKRDVEDILKVMESSSLRGLGGAGFPTGRKWRIVRAEPAPRIVAINIDEGEPGTFKDRFYLETDPHRFLEGLLIAAWAVQSAEVYIYLRDEYAGCREILQRELTALTQDPPCELPAIYLRRGAGAYICGEESAMIESIEGKRGMPRRSSTTWKPCTGSATSSPTAPSGSRGRAATAAKGCARSRCRGASTNRACISRRRGSRCRS
jgi:formate dehydrogenase